MAGTADNLKFIQQIFHNEDLSDLEELSLMPIAMHFARGTYRAFVACKVRIVARINISSISKFQGCHLA